MSKVRWLDRRVAAPGPYLCLALTKADYLAAMKHCKVEQPAPWVGDEGGLAHARCYFLAHPEHGTVVVVGVHSWSTRNPIEVAGLLVHEAVHIWQEYADQIGERSPGREQEAYAIQSIAQELMAEFALQMAEGVEP